MPYFKFRIEALALMLGCFIVVSADASPRLVDTYAIFLLLWLLILNVLFYHLLEVEGPPARLDAVNSSIKFYLALFTVLTISYLFYS